MMRKEELEKRLIDFSVSVSKICQSIDKTLLGRTLSPQLMRSAISPALNYGEAQGAESKKDFIHKLRISLKELKESRVSLKIIEESHMYSSNEKLNHILDECNQLVAIFTASIRTAESNKDDLT